MVVASPSLRLWCVQRELTNLELNNARKLASALDEQKLKLLGDQEDAVVMLKQVLPPAPTFVSVFLVMSSLV
jgi:hypothetical protein